MPEGDNDPRIVTRTEHNAATSFRDHGGGDPVEQEAVTGRPNDTPAGPAGPVTNTTLASRAQDRQKAEAKAVEGDQAENKAVSRRRARSK